MKTSGLLSRGGHANDESFSAMVFGVRADRSSDLKGGVGCGCGCRHDCTVRIAASNNTE